MRLEHGTNTKFDFPLIGVGKRGYGLYCYKRGNSSMRKYYGSEYILSMEIPDNDIIDLTSLVNYNHCKDFLKKELNKTKISKVDFQKQGHYLTYYIKKFYPDKKGFINFHIGDKIPNSKEIVIFDLSTIYNLKWVKDPSIDLKKDNNIVLLKDLNNIGM